jgi:DNA/RNA-binding domain of Phe-tRNA-synthetase-like protein
MKPSPVFVATDTWTSAFPAAGVGVLVMRGAHNPELSPELEARKRAVEASLRAHAARSPHRVGPVGRAYADYYRTYGKTYHVLAQWESLAVKGKAIPRRAALVEAMYIAELKNLILTAGHDLASIALSVRADVTHPGDRYNLMNGAERTLRAGDMMMVDGNGIISSVLYGPDQKPASHPKPATCSSPSTHQQESASTRSRSI